MQIFQMLTYLQNIKKLHLLISYLIRKVIKHWEAVKHLIAGKFQYPNFCRKFEFYIISNK